MIGADERAESPQEMRPGEVAPESERPHLAHERTCIGCGERSAPGDLVRLVLGPAGEVAVDAAGGGFGRGAHVHARAACLAQAATKGLARASKGKAASVSVAVKEGDAIGTTEAAPLTAASLAQAIETAMARRILGLLAAAVRTKKVRIGSDAVTGAWNGGDAALVVVATDAAAAKDLTAVREAVASGAAVSFGTKESLAGALFRTKGAGGDVHGADRGVAVAAITDTRIASAVRDAVEKTMGAHGAGRSVPSGRAGGSRESKRAGKVATQKKGFQSKVGAQRAGRASGRQQLRRAQGQKAVAERSE